MQTGNPTHVVLVATAVATVIGATMIAMWSFANVRPAWGVYNLAIATVASIVFIAVRARGRRIG